jgi:hypothetical protein
MDRIKNLEVEVAYLRKEISTLIELIQNLNSENHVHYTNIFYSKDYLDQLED